MTNVFHLLKVVTRIMKMGAIACMFNPWYVHIDAFEARQNSQNLHSMTRCIQKNTFLSLNNLCKRIIFIVAFSLNFYQGN